MENDSVFVNTDQSGAGRWMKLTEAAFALGISEITLRRRIKAGRLPFEFRDGRYYVLVREGDRGEDPAWAPPPRSTPTPTMPGTMQMKYENQIQLLRKQIAQREATIRELQRTVADQQTLITVLEEVVSDPADTPT